MIRRLLAAALALAAVAAPGRRAHAESPAECAPTEAVDPLRLLRQASLDVRGHVPSYDEYAAVRDADDPAAAVSDAIDGWFRSPSYFAEIRRSHQALLWGSLDQIVSLGAGLRRIFPDRRDGAWWIRNAARTYRGRPGLKCLDRAQTEFDDAGRPVPLETFEDETCLGGTCRREGWVEVTPYWDPEATIRVCAFDAQTTAVGRNGLTCDAYNPDPDCGCGANLDACLWPGAGEAPIRQALVEEPVRIFEAVVRGRQPYHEALRTRATFVNGPSAHFYRHQAGAAREEFGGATVYEPRVGDVPERPFTDDATWVRVEREEGHAGVLTTTAFLLRFASDRARANRFYTAFLCDPFVPSADGLPAEEENPSPNLRERAGCADCHGVLEPAASHWARWRNGGVHGFLDEAVMSFVDPRPDCLRCAEGRFCNNFCRSYFITPDNAHPEEVERWAGLPLARAWLTDADLARVEAGPLALTDEPHEVEQVARCAVRTLATRLLGRDLGAEDVRWVEEHTDAFLEDGSDYTAMFRRMLDDPKYRAIR